MQLKERQGGGFDARIYCIVSIQKGQDGRFYSIPNDLQISAYEQAIIDYKLYKEQNENGHSIFPNEHLPVMSGVFNAPLYGHSTWGSLFNARQLLALNAYVQLARKKITMEIANDREYGIAFAAVLGMLIDRLADLNATLCVWLLTSTVLTESHPVTFRN